MYQKAFDSIMLPRLCFAIQLSSQLQVKMISRLPLTYTLEYPIVLLFHLSHTEKRVLNLILPNTAGFRLY